MSLKVLLLSSIFICLHAGVYSQAVDNLASFRMQDADRYVRLHYENDFFSGTDLYYTQGINLEVVHPGLQKFPLSKILLSPAQGVTKYGLALEHNGYTPSSITHDNILYGDRPFAADFFLKSFAFSSLPEKRTRITSSASIGIIGAAAGGYGMQKTIHHWLNGTVPHGWENQIKNDIIINYEAGIEKNILSAGHSFLINGQATARAGTLNDKLTGGFVLMAGLLNNAITAAFAGDSKQKKRNFNFDAFIQPQANIVFYDATLQGGAFNRRSPYTLSYSSVEHLTFQATYGVVMNFHAISVEYFQTYLTKEFSTGTAHRWGGLRIAVTY
jgi:lipid A 3-O-deacylase